MQSRRVPVATDRQPVALAVSVSLPANQVEGTYSGTLKVSLGASGLNVPVELTVLPIGALHHPPPTFGLTAPHATSHGSRLRAAFAMMGRESCRRGGQGLTPPQAVSR